jgi:hypothetical protein
VRRALTVARGRHHEIATKRKKWRSDLVWGARAMLRPAINEERPHEEDHDHDPLGRRRRCVRNDDSASAPARRAGRRAPAARGRPAAPFRRQQFLEFVEQQFIQLFEQQLFQLLEQQFLELVLEFLGAAQSRLALSPAPGGPGLGRPGPVPLPATRKSMMIFKTKRRIEFLCEPDDKGVIAEPRPARDHLPAWFKKLPPIDRDVVSATNNGLTVKRCMPFFDAMTTGWILPLAASVRIAIKDGGCTVDAGWEFDRTMVSNHAPYQVAGHSALPRPPCKLHNYWTIRTPPGWSCLFVPPLNRDNGVVALLAGVVDTDRYASPIHFPFFATGPDGVHTLEKGLPLVQVIPFERRSTELPGLVRAERKGDHDRRLRVFRNTLAGDGWYRRFARAPRDRASTPTA